MSKTVVLQCRSREGERNRAVFSPASTMGRLARICGR